ncbi:RNA helicase [Neophaeococcomyces mojaviensis]|uniref:RNA helicase n=1 Tax=Neophaeococcomyces mojaviensis TaxID=3383035 RepID=A0ACC2ZWH3_9EURO|nr:RNA helicase [Knufia sp. JES_112]
MQAWSLRPTRCIFCTFRQSQRTGRSVRQSRQYSDIAERTHATRHLKLQGTRHLKSKESRGTKLQAEPGKSEITLSRLLQKQARRPGDIVFEKGKSEKRNQGEGDLRRELFKTNITRSLQQLESRLLETGSTPDGKLSQLDRLDPKGQRWPAFQKSVNATVRKPAKNQSEDEKELLSRLSRAFQSSYADLENQLYFEFLDHCLGSQLKQAPVSAFDLRYPTEWYAKARTSQRTIHLHVGPTNSGKTYNALKRLQEAERGFYAGPLRLLAHEVYSRFRANGIACDLITGDDVRYDESGEAEIYASTVEMVNTSREVEVAVIDEIQMMGNEERGWAWTRAFLGANAKEVHICGETRVIPLIRELAASMGDTLQVHHYERLNPLQAETRSLRGNLKRLQKGDCVVCFSIMGIHALKQQIEVETGRRAAIVYGSLPPETRAAQADLFNDPNNDYDFLVASDAIGMGLNLSVRRIIFETTVKFNGVRPEALTIPQIKQIAGRAGRYRSAHQDKTKSSSNQKSEPGLVTSLEEQDLPIIQAALKAEAPPLRKAMILPPAEYLEEYSLRLPPGIPFEYLLSRVCQTAYAHPRFAISNIRDKLKIARITDEVPDLSIEQRAQICACPLSGRDPRLAKCLKALAKAISDRRAVTVADIPEMPLEILAENPSADRYYLQSLEALHQCLTMFLWLSYRFITFFKNQPMAVHAKELTEQRINWTLRAFSANPKLRQRMMTKRKKEQEMVAEKFGTTIPTDGMPMPEAGGEAIAEVNESSEQFKEGYEGTDIIGESLWNEKDGDAAAEHDWDERPNDETFMTIEQAQEIDEQLQQQETSLSPASGDIELAATDSGISIAKEQGSQLTVSPQHAEIDDTNQPRAASAGS